MVAPEQDTPVFNGLAAGNYTVQVTDAFGFTSETNLTLDNPEALVSSAAATTDSIVIVASGGTGMLQYSIDGVNFQAEPVFENLPNGVYIVSVVDENGCSTSQEVIVAVNALLATATVTQNNDCFGDTNGSIFVNTGGGTAPLMFSTDGTNFQASNVFTNLPAGDYTITVKDALDTLASTNMVTISEPTALNPLANVTLGSISIDATGGTPTYAYSLDGVNFQASNMFENLLNGDYTITVMDAKGCTATIGATVDYPVLMISSVDADAIQCAGETTTLTVNAAGGIEPYTYALDNGSFQPDNVFENVGSGTYAIQTMDAAGNLVTFNVSLSEPDPLVLTVAVIGNDITTIVGAGGIPPYTFTWDASIPPNGMDLPNGTYSIALTDANGCSITETFTVNYTVVSATAQVTNPLCNGDANGSVTINGQNGTPPYAYSSDGVNYQGSNLFGNLADGIYTFYIRDAAGDVFTLPATVNEPLAISGSASVNQSTVTIAAMGGTAPLSYSLGIGGLQPSPVFTNVPNGTYTANIVDANGCTFNIENIIVMVSGTTDLAAEWGITIMPNPSSGRFLVTVSNPAIQTLRADVYDATGRLLIQENWGSGGAALAQAIDLTHLPQGIYTLRLNNGQQALAIRLVVQR
ncbi:MAG: T9SS type A sorting domain-containing protein [Lewinellaceae bacterium]|nr:T9SS type A sorting domain-containing protein [Lewinellaceae bacterium]